MTHVAYQPSGRDVALEVDHVVVGSGAGGATAAVTLARGGARVAVVEAGPWRDPVDYPSSVYGAMRDMLDGWGATFTRGRAQWPVVQGALVGGSTVVNSAICVRTPGDVTRSWAREHGLPDLSEPLGDAQDTLERELSAAPTPRTALGRHNRLALIGAERAGYASGPTERYARGCEGSGQCLQGCRGGHKQSLNLSFVPEVLSRGGDVLSCAPVARIEREGGRAVGVVGRFRHPQSRARGAHFSVRARSGVWVAASVTQTPLLLMRSGIRARALGEGFRSHPGVPLLGVYDEPVDMARGATQGWASVAFRDDPGFKLETLALPLDMLAGRLAGAGPTLMQRLGELRHLAMWVLGTRAESVGRIRPALIGKSAVRYSLGRRDMARLRAGLVTLARTHFAAGARAVIPSIFGLPYRLGPDEVWRLEQAPLDPRAYVAILSHLFGGCTMGGDPERSVCDAGGRVRGVDALYVADASVIPTNLGVNPQHTIMALARLFAERALDLPTRRPRFRPQALSAPVAVPA